MITRHRNYKHLFLSCILILSLVGLSGCGTTTPAPPPSPEPTPEPATPGRGAVTGQVMFRDGVPAHASIVYIFKEEASVSFASCNVDADGYYRFSNLAVGNYDLYATADVERTLFFGLAPDAQITVSEYETTTVPTITIRRHIDIACEEEYLTTTQPQLSWEAVPTAKYYLVEVKAEDYEKEIRVLDTQVTWSALTPGRYSVWLEAYNEQDTSIGTGYDSFWIGPRLPSED